ncbi:MAG TPA: M23 family metallopeptidase [Stellaceae bacterium]|jgi:murein DD-endopeptidase MepM/ murein hydrolase activator NlpD
MCSDKGRGVTRGPWGFVIGGVALAVLLAGCNSGPAGPAPIVMKGPADADVGGWQGPPPSNYGPPPRMASITPQPLPPPTPMHGAPVPPLSGPPVTAGAEQRMIVVERGQSLGRIAERYHIPKHAIIGANHLKPPYDIEIGQRLVLPGGEPARQIAQGNSIPLDGAPPQQQAPRTPAVVPLDGPGSRQAGALTPPTAAPAPPPPPGERSVADEAREDNPLPPVPARPPAVARAAPPSEAMHGGRLPWPVRGNVIAGYGHAGNGSKNDGINIAAPLGAPVRAIEGGEVAYAGNELKGYGNLVLIKHADGLISAYAHCQELLVRKGDKVAAGEVIARVGTTGGVKEPQLHFELREGQRPVDPKQFLAPAPSAANPAWSG